MGAGMNNFLAKTLSSINALIAIVILAFSTLSGATAAAQGGSGMFIVGAILGAIGGIVVAALICGTIAFLALIERHLSEIAAATRQPRS
jgi:membrane associated rhomboid family serine protease